MLINHLTLFFQGKMKITNYFKNYFSSHLVFFVVVSFFSLHKNGLDGRFWAKFNLSTTNVDISHQQKSRHSHMLISIFLLLLRYHFIRSNWEGNMPNHLLRGKLGVCHSADHILSRVKTVELKFFFFEGTEKQKCELFSKAIPMTSYTCILIFYLFNLDYSFLTNVL